MKIMPLPDDRHCKIIFENTEEYLNLVKAIRDCFGKSGMYTKPYADRLEKAMAAKIDSSDPTADNAPTTVISNDLLGDIFLLLCFTTIQISQADAHEQIDRLNKEIGSLKEENTALAKKNEGYQALYNKVSNESSAKDQKVSAAVEALQAEKEEREKGRLLLETANAQIEDLNKKLNSLQQGTDEGQLRLGAEKRLLNDKLNAAYRQIEELKTENVALTAKLVNGEGAQTDESGDSEFIQQLQEKISLLEDENAQYKNNIETLQEEYSAEEPMKQDAENRNSVEDVLDEKTAERVIQLTEALREEKRKHYQYVEDIANKAKDLKNSNKEQQNIIIALQKTNNDQVNQLNTLKKENKLLRLVIIRLKTRQ